jgi:GT2 family glycosyltransferase
MDKKISVIIVNWNGDEIIRACLDSIIVQEYQDYEIIVVDNGSTDNSIHILENEFDGKIELIKLTENCGFAKANNIGFQHSAGEYIFTLNNDAIIDVNFFCHILKTIEMHNSKKIGMLVPTILNYYNRNIIDSIGLSIYPDGIGRGRFRDKDINDINKSGNDVLCPSGCAAIYKTEMLKQIGFFDEEFFMYCEDMDLGLRALLAGWECIYCGDANVYHMYSYSAGAYSAKKLYYAERNRIFVLIKNFPLSSCFISIFFTLFRYTYQFITMHQNHCIGEEGVEVKEEFNMIKVLMKAYVDAIGKFKHLLRERRKLSKIRTIGTFKFIQLLISFRTTKEELAITKVSKWPVTPIVLISEKKKGSSQWKSKGFYS